MPAENHRFVPQGAAYRRGAERQLKGQLTHRHRLQRGILQKIGALPPDNGYQQPLQRGFAVGYTLHQLLGLPGAAPEVGVAFRIGASPQQFTGFAVQMQPRQKAAVHLHPETPVLRYDLRLRDLVRDGAVPPQPAHRARIQLPHGIGSLLRLPARTAQKPGNARQIVFRQQLQPLRCQPEGMAVKILALRQLQQQTLRQRARPYAGGLQALHRVKRLLQVKKRAMQHIGKLLQTEAKVPVLIQTLDKIVAQRQQFGLQIGHMQQLLVQKMGQIAAAFILQQGKKDIPAGAARMCLPAPQRGDIIVGRWLPCRRRGSQHGLLYRQQRIGERLLQQIFPQIGLRKLQDMQRLLHILCQDKLLFGGLCLLYFHPVIVLTVDYCVKSERFFHIYYISLKETVKQTISEAPLSRLSGRKKPFQSSLRTDPRHRIIHSENRNLRRVWHGSKNCRQILQNNIK